MTFLRLLQGRGIGCYAPGVRALRLLLLVVALAATGCMSRFRRANVLAEEGRFEEAAQAFEELAKAAPEDRAVADLLERARQRAVDKLLSEARGHRRDGRLAEAHLALGRALERRTRWNLQLSGALTSTIDDEVAEFTKHFRQKLKGELSKGHALSAEALLESHAGLLSAPELKAVKEDAVAAVAAEGTAVCKRLRPTAVVTTPWWTGLVAAYCAHFNEARVEWQPPADVFGRVEFRGQYNGLSSGLIAQLEGTVRQAVGRTPWLSKGAATPLVLEGAASLLQQPSSRRVRLVASWEEKIPYTHHVQKQVQKQVPYTEVVNGQTVHKLRTITEQQMVPETRFRTEARAYEYDANELTADYRVSLSVLWPRQGGEGLSVGLSQAHTERALWHDVVFAPAGVRPRHDTLSSAERFFTAQLPSLESQLEAALATRWQAEFCRRPSYSMDEAARCLRLGAGAPPARSELEKYLGGDVDAALKLAWGR